MKKTYIQPKVDVIQFSNLALLFMSGGTDTATPSEDLFTGGEGDIE